MPDTRLPRNTRFDKTGSLTLPAVKKDGIPGLKLINQNMAQQKNYHDLYRYAQERVSIDPQLCGRIYQSKYCHHFYSQAERTEWIRRWTAADEKGGGKAGDS